jgi:hypothetical protein
MVSRRRSERIRQKADVIKLSEEFYRDLQALRVIWNVPENGFLGDEKAQIWVETLYNRMYEHIQRYRGLFEAAQQRKWSEDQLRGLIRRRHREDPLRRLYFDIRELNLRYGLGKEFDNYRRLLWDSHLTDFFVGGATFCDEKSQCGILITPDLTSRDVNNREVFEIIREIQEQQFGERPSGGRGKKGAVVIGATRRGEPMILITPHLTWNALRREWHRVNAVQRERWPNYRLRERYKPQHERRKRLAELGGLNAGKNVYDLIDDLWGEDAHFNGDADRQRKALIYQDRHRLRRRLKPKE